MKTENNFEILTEAELENISGGGIAAYAIKGGCALAGAILGGFLQTVTARDYLKIKYSEDPRKSKKVAERILGTLKNEAICVCHQVAVLGGGCAGWKLGEEICKRLHI